MGRSYRVSAQGLTKAQEAFTIKGCTQDYLAGAAGCTRQTVIKFFAKKYIDKSIFLAICNELSLKWGDIADFESESSSTPSMSAAKENNTEDIQKPTGTAIAYAITGTVTPNDVAKFQAILALLQELSQDNSVKIIDIEHGSIKLILGGSQEGLERIETLFKSGKLKDVLGVSVEDVEFLTVKNSNFDKKQLAFTIAGDVAEGEIAKLKAALVKTSDDEYSTEFRNKSRSTLNDTPLDNTLQQFVSQNPIYRNNPISFNLVFANLIRGNLGGAFRILENLNSANLSRTDLSRTDLSYANLSYANLSYANLSNANLSNANLSDANLSDANLSDANLSDANLSRTDLSNANLSGANLSRTDLSRTDLSNANLSDANLSNANLSDAIVVKALFGGTVGLIDDMKRDLERRGAIFGDRPPVTIPR